jgi:hypothetical protein
MLAALVTCADFTEDSWSRYGLPELWLFCVFGTGIAASAATAKTIVARVLRYPFGLTRSARRSFAAMK